MLQIAHQAFATLHLAVQCAIRQTVCDHCGTTSECSVLAVTQHPTLYQPLTVILQWSMDEGEVPDD